MEMNEKLLGSEGTTPILTHQAPLWALHCSPNLGCAEPGGNPSTRNGHHESPVLGVDTNNTLKVWTSSRPANSISKMHS